MIKKRKQSGKFGTGRAQNPRVNELQWLDEAVTVSPRSRKRPVRISQLAAIELEAEEAEARLHDLGPEPEREQPREAERRQAVSQFPLANPYLNSDARKKYMAAEEKGLGAAAEPRTAAEPVAAPLRSERPQSKKQSAPAGLRDQEGIFRPALSTSLRERVEISPAQTVRANLPLSGTVPFRFRPQDDSIEVAVPFGEAYRGEAAAVVAMTNHPACYAVLKQYTSTGAVLTVVRTKYFPNPQGTLTWIAVLSER